MVNRSRLCRLWCRLNESCTARDVGLPLHGFSLDLDSLCPRFDGPFTVICDWSRGGGIGILHRLHWFFVKRTSLLLLNSCLKPSSALVDEEAEATCGILYMYGRNILRDLFKLVHRARNGSVLEEPTEDLDHLGEESTNGVGQLDGQLGAELHNLRCSAESGVGNVRSEHFHHGLSSAIVFFTLVSLVLNTGLFLIALYAIFTTLLSMCAVRLQFPFLRWEVRGRFFCTLRFTSLCRCIFEKTHRSPAAPRGEVPARRNPEQVEKAEEDSIVEEENGTDSWSMSDGFTYRHHEVHRTKLYVPDETTFAIP